MNKIAFFAAALALTAPAIVHAEQASDATTNVAVRYGDLNLANDHDAGVLLTRLQTAALNSCGASEFSFRDYQDAVRKSACYQASLSNAVAQVGSPALTARFTTAAPVTLASN
jgi:UrcA family protein